MRVSVVTRLHLPSRRTHIVGMHRDAEGARQMMNDDVHNIRSAYAAGKAIDTLPVDQLSLENFEWAVDEHRVLGDEGVVYVIEYSVDYEGCSLCGVFESKDEAMRAAQKLGRDADIEIRACGLNYAHKQYTFEEKPLIPRTDWTG